MKSLRIILYVVVFLGISKSYATTYYACGTGITWDGTTSFLYTTPDCSSGGPVNPNSLTSADEMVIQSGAVVIVTGSVTLNAIKLTVYGTLYIKAQGTPGKLTLPDNSATVVLQSGSNVACYDTSLGTEVTCQASSTQIIVGSGGSKWTYKGSDIDAVNSYPKPTTLDNTGGPLPVLLNSIASQIKNSSVNLVWSTASELNFDYFSLQRSGDGTTFNEIAQVKGHGTTNEGHSYSYEDNNPIIGRSYYRLTSIDFDNYQETFKVVAVDFHGEKKFQVSPNPTDGSTVKLNFNFANDADATVTIYDNLGLAIGTYPVSGSGSINFDNTLKSGVYLAKYTSPTFSKTERFLVK